MRHDTDTAAGSKRRNWMDRAFALGATNCITMLFTPAGPVGRSLAAMRIPPEPSHATRQGIATC